MRLLGSFFRSSACWSGSAAVWEVGEDSLPRQLHTSHLQPHPGLSSVQMCRRWQWRAGQWSAAGQRLRRAPVQWFVLVSNRGHPTILAQQSANSPGHNILQEPKTEFSLKPAECRTYVETQMMPVVNVNLKKIIIDLKCKLFHPGATFKWSGVGCSCRL